MLKCPSCQSGILKNEYLETALSCKTCNVCGGHWLLLEDYLEWRNGLDAGTLERLEGCMDSSLQVELAKDSTKILICPQTGTFMTKYYFSNKSPHRVDLSPLINAIWLDQGEWVLLKSEGLIGRLNSIFTSHWQNKLKNEAVALNFERFYEQKLSSEDFEEAKRIRLWLKNHEQSDFIRAFITG